YDAAHQRYEAALASAPDLFQALAPLAEIHYGREELEEARPYLERCAVSPDLGGDSERAADLLHALALSREKGGDRAGAAAALKATLEHKASHAQVLEDLARRTRVPTVRATHELSLARALSKTGEPERALELFKRGLERQPDD